MRQEAGGSRQEAGGRRQEAGGRRQELCRPCHSSLAREWDSSSAPATPAQVSHHTLHHTSIHSFVLHFTALF